MTVKLIYHQLKMRTLGIVLHVRGSQLTHCFMWSVYFVERVTTKKCYNDSKLIKFSSFKHRNASWQSIEPRAFEIGDTQLSRLVQEQDLFAGKAQYYASCENQCKLNYLKYQKSKAESGESFPPDTEQSRTTSAHQNAHSFVVHKIHSLVNRITEFCN